MKLTLKRSEIQKMWRTIEPMLGVALSVFDAPTGTDQMLRKFVDEAASLEVKTKSGLTLRVTFEDELRPLPPTVYASPAAKQRAKMTKRSKAR